MLAAIERDLNDEAFTVIGVHSPKFTAQRDPELVAAAVRRLGVTHPQVLDPDLAITSSYGVRGWPTMLLVGPDGSILATLPGEPEPQALLGALRELVGRARGLGLLDPRPLPLSPVTEAGHRFRFPGAVATAGGRIFIADTGHDEVAILDPAAGGQRVRGLAAPHGLAPAGETLYVAGTGDHTLRAVDLAGGTVSTVAGPPLRSPWGLAWDGRRVFIANAGTHQIWAWDPATGQAAPFAGTGAEGGRDGAAADAWFAQPSGLALMDGVLYVADAETSSIRAISDLDGRPWVRTVCGAGDLFGFGDRDGAGPAAELQHPIGLAAGGRTGLVYVADTFNHKIRTVDPATGTCRTLFGGGGSELAGDLDPEPAGTLAPAAPDRPAFLEPEGVAVAGDELIVADTGNHRVLAVNLASGARRVL